MSNDTQMPSDDDLPDDDAYAAEMRAYWTFRASQPDNVQYLADLAEQRDLDRMEEDGIAAAEAMLSSRR